MKRNLFSSFSFNPSRALYPRSNPFGIEPRFPTITRDKCTLKARGRLLAVLNQWITTITAFKLVKNNWVLTNGKVLAASVTSISKYPVAKFSMEERLVLAQESCKIKFPLNCNEISRSFSKEKGRWRLVASRKSTDIECDRVLCVRGRDSSGNLENARDCIHR